MASELKVNIYFRTFETPKACGIYDQNNLIGLIESALRTVQPDLAPHPRHEAVGLSLWCAWDGGENARFNRSRLFCDTTFHRVLPRRLSERLTAVGQNLVSVHSQTSTQFASSKGIGISLFDVNGVGVDEYVKSILTRPKEWLDALTSP